MNITRQLSREIRFFVSRRSTVLALALLSILCTVALILGSVEISRQHATIARVAEQDQFELAQAQASATDFGGAAYSSFSLTWHTPSDAAFLAIGQRDVSPWMLRIRALALEGQIHEADNFNPELSLTGRFDYAFVIAFLLPLFVIVLLYDLYSYERDAGRLPLLAATAASTRKFWSVRAIVATLMILMAALIPLWILGLSFGATTPNLLNTTAVVILAVACWSAVVMLLAFRKWSSAVIATSLMGLWILVALAIPLAGKVLIDQLVPRFDGAQISLLQRETVNAAWDLPKAATMEPFYASHPEWSHSAPVTAPFHWKWFYAFQQIGDEAAAERSSSYREAISARDALTGYVAWFSPPVAVLRAMQDIAGTDVQAVLSHEQQIRAYHARIRHFFYPLLFEEVAFDHSLLADFPIFGQE